MSYSISEVSKMLNIPTSTLRYYDKQGLLPSLERQESGIRVFKQDDLEWLYAINCLKRAGLSIESIKKFVDLIQQGDSTIGERLEMFKIQREIVTKQIDELNKTLKYLDFKVGFYETAQKEGSVEKAKETLKFDFLAEIHGDTDKKTGKF